ncbi:MAG: cytochrome c [Proteobacteria bacterium]|nr:cytochrome c [Pseudomonadota bacterium]
MDRSLGFVRGLILVSVFSCASVLAADNTALLKAKELSATLCFTCHGTDGISPEDLYPNLRGQNAAYLEKQLKAYRDGSRVDPVMNSMASSLDDAVIHELAKYYSNGADKPLVK